MADATGNSLVSVDLENDLSLKKKYYNIQIKEKLAQIKQLELNKNNLEIEADKYHMQIEKAQKEVGLMQAALSSL